MLEVNGPKVLWYLGFLALVTFVPLVFPKLKIPAAVILLLCALVSGIGMFYCPSVVLLFWPEQPREHSERYPGG